MSSSWWEAKIKGEEPIRTPPLPPIPAPRPPATASPYPVAPSAPSRTEPRCPECGSGNYYGGRSGAMPRCFDCGFVPHRDFRNSTQGLIGDGPVEKAPGQQPGSYNPQQVIGTIE